MTQASQKEVRITYETLYELFRREKNREELQQLDPLFYTDVLNYFRDKQQYHSECMSKSDLFSLSERDKTLQQLQNAKKILKELYEKREKKILELAVNKSRTNSSLINTANLLAEERALYEALVETLNTWRDGMLVRLMALQEPAFRPDIPEQAPARPEIPDEKTKLVRFTEEVEQFVGEELEVYGPFQANDKAYLPAVLADILITSGKAVQLNEQS